MKISHLSQKNIIISAVVAIVIVGGLSFYGGTKYAIAQRAGTRAAGFGAGTGAGAFSGANGTGQRGMRVGMMGGAVAGEVISKDATSMVVKLRDGGSKIVLISASTPVFKSTMASSSDIAVGNQVMVFGSTGTDGTVAAQSVQIR